MSVTQWFQSQAADFYNTGHKSWSHCITDVSVPKANMLKNSSILDVSVHGLLYIRPPHCKYGNIIWGLKTWLNVGCFRYLGVIVTNTNVIHEEIKRRINM